MATRRERVILDLEDNLSGGMAKAAGATALLNRELNELSRTSVQSSRSSQTFVRDVDSIGRASKGAASEVDRLSGRMRIFFDAAAVLGPSLVPIGAVAVPAVTGLASQLGFAAIGMSSLIAASQGVGDALKAVNDAALEPTAANLEKARVAMERLGPEAQEFVARFQELRPVLKDIRDAAAAGWFPGLTSALDDVERVGPRVASIFEAIGKAGGSLVADGASALAGPQMDEFLTFVESNAPQALDDLGRTLGNVIKGLSELWMAFDPLNDDFSTWLLDASRAFAEWADGLSQTDGFADFVDYIRTNGPKVADALVAVGDAVLQIIEALAPLGGPSLKIIETFADAIGAIADSNLGTPILAGVAALALYNRTMQASIAIQRQLGLSAAATGGGVGLLAGTRGTAAKSSLGGLRADVAAMGAIWATSGARTEREAARMSGALASAKTNMSGLAKAAGPAGIALTGLALASSGSADGLLSSNTAMLGLMGTMAGPWGAVAGVTIGQFVDMKKAIADVDAVIASGDQGLASSALQRRLDIATSKNPIDMFKSFNQAREDIYAKVTTGETNTSRLAKQAGKFGGFESLGEMGITTLEQAQAHLAGVENSLRRAEAGELGLSSASSDLAAKMGFSNAAIAESIALIDRRTSAANGAFGAETNWRNALKAATEQANNNNAGIKGNSDAALANRSALESLSSAWFSQRDAMVEAGRSAEHIEGKYKTARSAFIKTAVAMGVPIKEARRLARELLAIPESVATEITVGGAKTAAEIIAGIKAQLSSIPRSVRTDFYVNQVNSETKRNQGIIPKADGGTVPGERFPYADKTLIYAAPGEEVITNRNGEADAFRRDRASGRIPAYANGGTVGSQQWASGGALSVMATREASEALRGLAREAKSSKDQLAGLRSRRESLVSARSTLSGSVKSGLTSDLFGGNEWSDGGDPNSILRGDIAKASAFARTTRSLKSKGVSGSALDAILADGDLARAQQMAGRSTAYLRDYQRSYAVRERTTASAGNTAGSATYGAAIAGINKEIRALRADLRAEHREDRKDAKKGMGSAARRNPRGYVKP